jgi:hypothetical protein
MPQNLETIMCLSQLEVDKQRQLATERAMLDPVVFVVGTDSGFAMNTLSGNAPSKVKNELRQRIRDGEPLWVFCVPKTHALHLVARLHNQIVRLSKVVIYFAGDQITLAGQN